MTSIAKVEPVQVSQRESVPATTPTTITEMLQLAIEKGVAVEALEKLVGLHERVSDRAARTEFITALADFQRHCPPIAKTAKAKITTKSGTSYSYDFAPLDHVADVVREPLHARGFSFSWDSVSEGKMLTSTCTLRHVNGHSEKASFTLPVDSASAMSEQQKYVAALSFAKRMSLTEVLGITTADKDTDGVNPEPISHEHAVELQTKLEEIGADVARFFQYMGVQSFHEIRRVDLDKAVTALEEYQKAKEKRAAKKAEE